MTELTMPPARDFGWAPKPTESSHFAIHERPNGQFCVVLNHALLRGCTADMIQWWFLHFPNLSVKLIDSPGYEGKIIPAYLLWHPIDHLNATLSGVLGPDRTSRAGASIHIREAMQYDKFGWKYPVDAKLKLFYVASDGWAMGKSLPLIGPVMILRIHFKDVMQDGRAIGVHYHYEVVIGATADNMLTRLINKRLCAKFGPEFFDAWHRHNVIEVGVFENFLPPLFDQNADLTTLSYQRDMDPKPFSPSEQKGCDLALFERRLGGFRKTNDPFAFQQADQPTFL
ncbi:MAG: hypothetical protein AAGA21_19005 [Pseudomonadota bacterium]